MSSPFADLSAFKFTLKGRSGPVFRVVKQYDAAGFIPSVIGVTLDGRYMTAARVEDVDLVADTIL